MCTRVDCYFYFFLNDIVIDMLKTIFTVLLQLMKNLITSYFLQFYHFYEIYN